MEKTYDPKQIEAKYCELWERQNLFSAKLNSNSKHAYCIMLPPPNVTGNLHMGHAFQHTIMDVLIRYNRAQGKQTLWQTGTDHAGIATQMVVERQLATEGIKRLDIGRKKFIKKVWSWKQQSGGAISTQMRRLGASVDWSKERFTMDEGLSSAVNKVFIELYNEGLIYRGKRLVNWDPVLQTALSDLEVVAQEEVGVMYYVKYHFVHNDNFIKIATTRPETILADGAIAVNPQDKRYNNLIGKWVWVPMTERKIPIIADNYVDMNFGTGCMKITPAHDFNDWEVGKRHKIPIINLFTKDAKLNANAPKAYQGLERFQARKDIVKDLAEAKLLIKTETHKLNPPRGDRSGAILEPYLTDQWFVKIAPLAKPAIEAVKNNDIRFIPKNWTKTYFNWMQNIEDWCISRQIWWGHRIPAWYNKNGDYFVANSLQEAEQQAKKAGVNFELKQDDDVLDTWFSSALWPFSTLGWPQKTEELARFYPTNVLVTGFDIIFFWVARMIMLGLKFSSQIPFKDVYITGLIRDNNGQKMSKSKGNVIDPIDIIDGISLDKLLIKRTQGLMQPKIAEKIKQQTTKDFAKGIPAFGADALRFTFIALASFGRDLKFDLKRVAGYRNFCNKLWNASRFILMKLKKEDISSTTALSNIDKWIISRLQITKINVEKHIKDYRLDLMSTELYEFVWHDYCDWYLELAKQLLKNDETKISTQATLFKILNEILLLLYPIIPFITEKINSQCQTLSGQKTSSLATKSYPKIEKNLISKTATNEIKWLQTFILGVRQIRSKLNIPHNKLLPCLVQNINATDKKYLDKYLQILCAIAKLQHIKQLAKNDNAPQAAISLVEQMKILIPLANLIDKAQEISNLQQKIAKLNKQKQQFSNKFNSKFINAAPKNIIEKEKEKINTIKNTIHSLSQQLEKISNL